MTNLWNQLKMKIFLCCQKIIIIGLLSSDWDWDFGPGTWDLGPGNRIENCESRIENRESRIENQESRIETTPSPSADSKMPGATTHHHHPITFRGDEGLWQQSAFGKNVSG